jgi:guanylate kinase
MSGLIVVLSGPGGVGKGTIVRRLVDHDRSLHLSRSWTTRQCRPEESQDAYVFVSRDEFEARIERDGFLEYTEFLGNYYGTPSPEVPDGLTLVLEIEVDGAQQVKRLHPDAVLVFVLPPSREEQERRLRGRGDPEDKVQQRVRKAEDEEPVGIAIADHVVVNDDLDRTVSEIADLIEAHRAAKD